MTKRQRPAAFDDGLPAPGADALDSSRQLSAILHARIQAAGGWIPFADWMDGALNEPGLGYYSGGATKLGREGDFITAPTLSPLFAWTLAAEAARLPQAADTILELGPGDGAMARDLLSELDRLGHAPCRYLLLEPSASLAARQRETLRALPTHLQSRINWLSSLPETPFDGLILANEVMDALPVRRFRVGGDGVLEELGVRSTGQGFSWEAQPIADDRHPVARAVAAITTAIGHALPAGFVSEYAPGAGVLLRTLADCLRSGVILITDYGALREAYYHPERSSGTLRAYYRHRVLDDPFRLPGLQDITAHVDFSALIDAARGAGLDVLEFCSQLRFLLGAGLPEVLAARMRDMEPIAALSLAQSAKVLMLPSEMGEIFKALAVGKGLDHEPPAFRVQSRLNAR